MPPLPPLVLQITIPRSPWAAVTAEIGERKRNYDWARQYLQRSIEMLKQKGYSPDCEKIFNTLGTNSRDLVERIDGMHIADGTTSNVKYVNTLTGVQQFIHNLAGDNRTVTQVFEQEGMWGYTDGNENRIWINSNAVLSSGVYENAANFLHELVHSQTGLGDGQIQLRLGLQVGAGSDNVSARLQADCIGTALAPK